MRLLYTIYLLNILFGDYGGGYAGSAFRYGSNAREFSLAGAVIADKTPGFYSFSNPALLHFSHSEQFGMSYQSLSLDRYVRSFSYIKDLPPAAGVSLSVISTGTNNIEGKDAMNRSIGMLSSREIKGSISFGVAISTRLAVGLNIKAFFPSIAPEVITTQNGQGIGWDIGLIYKVNRHFILGFVIENINTNYNWKLTKYDKQDSYAESLPQIIKFGISYTGFKGASIYFQEDMVNIPAGHINYRLRFGIEYRLKNNIRIRGGLKQIQGVIINSDNEDKNIFSPTFGTGIPVKIWKKQYMQLDYALDIGRVNEGISHLFSFAIKFN